MEENNTPNTTLYQLIFDEQSGTISPHDKMILESWKASAKENSGIYDEIAGISRDIELLGVRQGLDPEKSWKEFSQSVFAREDAKSHKILKVRKINYFQWGAAAAAILIIGLLLTANLDRWSDTIHFQTGKNERRQLMLPDGSEIIMNQNTSLHYNKEDFAHSRNIEFTKGEAYFKIIHDKNRPFLIKTDELDVIDLGTSFNLSVGQQQIMVVVNSGKVAMKHKSDKKIILSEQDKGTFDKSTKAMVQNKNDNINYKAWYDKTLYYQQTPLDEVSKDLEQVFGTKIIFEDDSLRERRLNGFFKDKSADEIMQIIGTSLSLKVIKRNGNFILTSQ
ncbi:FecR family protein [Pedobacter sp. N36a]|uniref:FecR family protein n=1 Tax=Pedobacter sp. N36a TaxID=2767996 RepID=UPI001656F630|nr:FecR family protein [Pedobacter sp. N36a]MBC8986814.1 FecR family protein [Pedobacter sp. N36a]